MALSGSVKLSCSFGAGGAGLDETDDAPVGAHDAVEEEPHLVIHCGAQLTGHLREFDRIEGFTGQFPDAEPLRPDGADEGDSIAAHAGEGGSTAADEGTAAEAHAVGRSAESTDDGRSAEGAADDDALDLDEIKGDEKAMLQWKPDSGVKVPEVAPRASAARAWQL